jgi:hypothetical protein
MILSFRSVCPDFTSGRSVEHLQVGQYRFEFGL